MGQLAPALEIRAHHLLCLLGFRGRGYSEEFVSNMEKVAQATFSNTKSLKVIDHCDVICLACPHRQGNECHKREDSAVRVARKDRRVMAKLGMLTGVELAWSEVRALVEQKISPETLLEICRDCEWLKLGYCLEAIRELSTDPR